MNNFCGIRLSTFGMVIGWLSLIGSVFSTILLIVGLTQLDAVVKTIQNQMSEPDKDLNIQTAVIIAFCVYLTISLANVFASVMLIVGTIRERHLLLTPWLVNGYILIFVNVLNFIYLIYMSIGNSIPVGSALSTLIPTGLSLAIQCWIWNAIYSLYKQIRETRELQQRLLPTTSKTYYSDTLNLNKI